MVRITVTRKIGVLLALFTAGGLVALAVVIGYFAATAGVGPFLDVAGRQRMLCEQMAGAARDSAGGGAAARDLLRVRAAAFEAALRALEAGGPLGEVELPPPVEDVRPELRAARALWGGLDAPIRAVVERPAADPAAAEARALLLERLPGLRDASHGVVLAFERWRRGYRERVLALLYALAAGDVLLLAAGLYLTRRFVGRPIRLVEEAARRIQEGDYSARVPVLTSDELATLARTFNGMSEKVGALIASVAASEKRFRELVEDIDAVVWERDAGSGRFTFVSRQVERILGHPAERFEAEPGLWESLIRPEDREEAVARCRESLEKGRDSAFHEAGFATAAGGTAWLRCAARAVRGPGGSLRAIRGVSVDVSERRRAEEALRLHDRAMAAITQGVVLAELSEGGHRIVHCNRAFEEITGWSREEILGRDPGFLRGPLTDPAATEAISTAIRERRPCSVEVLNYRKDGRPFWNALSLAPVPAPGGRIGHYVGVISDVTEQKRTAEQLRQATKMEAVGRLAGGVAHDFNNMLTAIIGYAALLQESPELSESLRAPVGEVRRAAERSAALARQLLAFSRKQILEPRVISLNEHVEGLKGMLRRLIREDIDLCLVLDPALGSARLDPSQVEQVIVNLVVNARDALPEGGKLTIETANVDLDAAYAASHAGVSAGPHVLLAVSDTGSGMPPEVLAHAFEPFFTTKPVGQGTGLGLATVYGIVKQSGGHVWAYSELGHGTTIKAYFPRVEAPRVPEERRALAPRAGGDETLLVVEDEEVVRRLACRVLRKAGYTVLEAAAGPEALRLCDEHPGPIALMLADVVMPGMTGRALAERAAGRRPEMRVLFTSGYTENAIVHHGVLDAGVDFIGKPFAPQALLRKVRDLLDRPRGASGA